MILRRVQIDLPTGTVEIESSMPREALVAAITDDGYGVVAPQAPGPARGPAHRPQDQEIASRFEAAEAFLGRVRSSTPS